MNGTNLPGRIAGASCTPRNSLEAVSGQFWGEFGALWTEAGSIHLVLPFPPSSNRYWRKTKTGQVYVSEEARAYRDEVKWITRQTVKKPLIGPLRMALLVARPRRAGDLMNREKILSDALQGAALVNDGQIVEAHLFLVDDKKNPRVEVTLTPLFNVK